MAAYMPAANSIMINHENIIKMFRLIDMSIASILAGTPSTPKSGCPRIIGSKNPMFSNNSKSEDDARSAQSPEHSPGSREDVADSITTSSDLELPANDFGVRGVPATQKLCEDIAAAQEAYFIGVSPFIVAHRMLTTNIRGSVDPAHIESEANIRAAYFEFIGERGIVSTIDRCVDALLVIIRLSLDDNKSKSDNMVALSDLDIELKRSTRTILGVEYMLSGDCECGGEFVMYAESNERKCSSCGMTASIADDHVEDQNMYSKDIQKTKQNRHHPLHHCKIWISRIQAWVGPDVPDSVYIQLKTCFTRDNVNLRNMSCSKLRKYLKEKKLTAYNNYVPFIRKVMCGISPPQLTNVELERLYETFARVAKVLHDMRPDNNINYYPVFIFKILDEQLPLSTRKVQIMECIHLQSEDTIKEIDNLYAQICARMGRADKPRPINWGEYKKFL